MKCSVIRDLIPNYIDELCSMDSDKLIEDHLSVCEECKQYYMQMKKEMTTDTCKGSEVINPFIKIKRNTLKKVVLAMLITACIVSVVWEQYVSFYTSGKSMYSDEVEVKVEENNGIVTLRFEAKEESVIVEVGFSQDTDISLNGKTPLQTLQLIKRNYHEQYSKGLGYNQYQLYFNDDGTVLDLFSDVNEFQYEDDDYFAVLYNDGYQVIYLKDLKEGNANQIQFVEDCSVR